MSERLRALRDVIVENTLRFDTYALGTMFMIVVYHDANEPLESFYQLSLAATLLVRRLRVHPVFWLIMGVVLVAQAAFSWATANNHDFLLGYWSLAIGLAATRPDPLKVLARSGALLLGIVFALVTGWRLITPNYLSGDFFEKTVLTDSRFDQFAYRLGGLDLELHEENDKAYDELRAHDSLLESIPLHITDRLRSMSLVLMVYILLVEALIATAFIFGWPRPPWGVWILLAFCVSTYIVAPVVGFGSNLMLMACVATPEKHRWSRAAMFSLFIVFPAFDVAKKVLASF